MSRKNPFRYIYKISRGYRKVTIFVGDAKTGERISTSGHAPFPHFTRKEKYAIICEKLAEYGIPIPSYK